MPKRKYKEIKFQSKSLELIELVNRVIAEYDAQGYELTLRQVYYQLVARGYIPNNERSYKNLGNLISDGRLAGLIDWFAIVDRTRNLRGNSHWEEPQSVIESAKYSYMLDRWENQPNYVEVWVARNLMFLIFRAGGTHHSLKCGLLHSVSFVKKEKTAEPSFTLVTMTQVELT